MKKEILTTSQYKDLIRSVKSSLKTGLVSVQKVLEYQRLKTYWEIGSKVYHYAQDGQEKARLTKKFYAQVCEDVNRDLHLSLTIDTLQRTVQFYKNYPVFPKKTTLTFTHYMALQKLKDPKIRLRLEKEAIHNNFSVLDVKASVIEMNVSQTSQDLKNSKTLPLKRGEPYVYSQRVETSSSGKSYTRIDCGFKINIDPPQGPDSLSLCSRVVRSIKEDGHYYLRVIEKGKSLCYTYSAQVVRVVDGDTLDVRIDVGFGIYLNDRLRLKGINAGEINTPWGQNAKKFLEKYLSCCPLIIIRTYKEGVYGRWIADIFALKGCNDPLRIAKEGEFLNQVLLDEGLADIF